MQRRYQIEVFFSGFIVQERLFLQCALHLRQGDDRWHRLFFLRFHRGPVSGRNFQVVEGHTSVTIGGLNQVVDSIRLQGYLGGSKSPVAVGHCCCDNGSNVLVFERMQRYHPASGQQRGNDLEGRILGGGAN